MDPSEDEISQVIDFAGLNPFDDRKMVISALKDNNRNVETVVMQFFDNPNNFRQKYLMTWNEDMFSADREGGTNNTGISFHIESVNQNDIVPGVTPPPPGYAAGAPSRPPSRSNDRSPITSMVDWTTNDVPGGAPLHQEDQDMQRALRESAQEAGLAVSSMPQETGVTDASTSNPYFGPANRSDYDTSSWAMVPVGGSAPSSSGDSKPSLRKRSPGAPAFLIQGSNYGPRHRMGGLLTILHEIPLARNIFLQCGAPSANYGYNTKWWEGQAILPTETPKEIPNNPMHWGEQEQTPPLNLEEEMHRLMAFLDSTERGYASVGALCEIIQSHSDPEKPLFERLSRTNTAVVEPLYQTATTTSLWDNDSSSQDTNFSVLHLDHLRADHIYIKTLYESIDHVFWGDALTWNDIGESSKLVTFSKMGQVMIIQCGGDGPEDSIEIPLEFYPAKYLMEQKDEARRIQLAWNKTKIDMGRLLEEQKELQTWENDWKYPQDDKKGLMNKVQHQWKALANYLETCGNFRAMEAAGFDTNLYSDYRAAPSQLADDEEAHKKQVENVLLLAERVLSDVEARAKSLRTQLEQIQAKQRFLSRLLTDPDKKGRPKSIECNRYYLRGVATEKDVLYVCQRLEGDLIDLEDEPKPVDQWWRLAFAPNDAQRPVQTEKIEVERVLREVWQETKTPILVYATEESLNQPRLPLSDPLTHFVRSENRTFRQELSRESARSSEERGRAGLDTLSPSKRKHRSDSPDSMNSNRASLGSNDRGDFENPFGDHMEGMSMGIVFDRGPGGAVDLSSFSGPEGFRGAADLSSSLLPTSAGQEDGDVIVNVDALSAQQHEAKAEAATSLSLDMQPAEEVEEDDEKENQVAPAPEMQERARPSLAPFMAPTGEAQHIEIFADKDGDMELPDHDAQGQ